MPFRACSDFRIVHTSMKCCSQVVVMPVPATEGALALQTPLPHKHIWLDFSLKCIKTVNRIYKHNFRSHISKLIFFAVTYPELFTAVQHSLAVVYRVCISGGCLYTVICLFLAGMIFHESITVWKALQAIIKICPVLCFGHPLVMKHHWRPGSIAYSDFCIQLSFIT